MIDSGFFISWTPFFLMGFVWNLLVTVLAVAIGTVVGAALAHIRFGGSRLGNAVCVGISKVFRNVPTLAFLFAAVFILPRHFEVSGEIIEIPLWFKAALGLSPSIIGFTSESLLIARQAKARGDYGAALLFLPTWGNSVLITFLASSTASLVGVSELISRSNTLIAATDSTNMVAVYLYAAMIFMVGCFLWMTVMRLFRRSALIQSLPQKWAAQAGDGGL
jgi:polar amino acid transport system permease protein